MGLLERGAEAFEVMHDIEFAMTSEGATINDPKDQKFFRDMQRRIAQFGRTGMVLKGELKWIKQIRDTGMKLPVQQNNASRR